MVTSPDVNIEGDALTLRNHALIAETNSVQDLEYVLSSLGRTAIVDRIETLYEQTKLANPDAQVVRPSIRAIRLGTSSSKVLSEYGQRNRTSLYRSIVEIQPHYRDYWNAIQGFDFTPEVRSMGSARAFRTEQWLLLRNPETDPPMITPLAHLPRALGFLEPAVTREIGSQLKEAFKQGDMEGYKSLWAQLSDENEAAVDRQIESYDTEARAPAQLGLIIANANLRTEIKGEVYTLDEDGYLADLVDAEEYAYRKGLSELAEMLTMEMERVRFIRDN